VTEASDRTIERKEEQKKKSAPILDAREKKEKGRKA
jgi:hypothetical protein